MRRDRTRLGRLLIPLLLGALALGLPSGAAAVEPATGRISGTVTAEGGGPLEGIEVCAEPIGEGSYRCDDTRVDGTYEITGLKAGKYEVEFWSERVYVTQWWDDATSPAAATPVVVTAGEVTPGIDATLEPSASISGIVTAAATGQPVAYVEACASLTGGPERCGESNALGEYTITGLYEGSWNLYFYAYETEADLISQPYAGGPVTLNAKEAKTGIDAALVAGGQIAGTVRLASTGAPLSGVLVCLTEATSIEPDGCLHTPTSGAYRFTGIWAGSFKVVFSPERKALYPEEPEWGEELEEWEAEEGYRRSYATQWWQGQTTFAAATPIAITPPAQVTGVDGSLTSTTPPPAAVVPPVTPKPVTKPVLKCKRGYVKRRVKGKARCVKKKPKRHHKKAHRRTHRKPSA